MFNEAKNIANSNRRENNNVNVVHANNNVNNTNNNNTIPNHFAAVSPSPYQLTSQVSLQGNQSIPVSVPNNSLNLRLGSSQDQETLTFVNAAITKINKDENIDDWEINLMRSVAADSDSPINNPVLHKEVIVALIKLDIASNESGRIVAAINNFKSFGLSLSFEQFDICKQTVLNALSSNFELIDSFFYCENHQQQLVFVQILPEIIRQLVYEIEKNDVANKAASEDSKRNLGTLFEGIDRNNFYSWESIYRSNANIMAQAFAALYLGISYIPPDIHGSDMKRTFKELGLKPEEFQGPIIFWFRGAKTFKEKECRSYYMPFSVTKNEDPYVLSYKAQMKYHSLGPNTARWEQTQIYAQSKSQGQGQDDKKSNVEEKKTNAKS